jgi:Phage integrase, N-terminal SAM-like domain
MKGSIHVRTLKDGKTKSYGATFRGPDGKQRWKFFPREGDAEQFLVEQVRKIHKKEYRPVTPRLFGEVIDHWLDFLTVRVQQGKLKPSTVRAYRVTVNKHIRPTFGPLRSDRITPGLMKDWDAAQAKLIAEKKAAPESYNFRLTIFGSLLGWARKRAASSSGMSTARSPPLASGVAGPSNASFVGPASGRSASMPSGTPMPPC